MSDEPAPASGPDERGPELSSPDERFTPRPAAAGGGADGSAAGGGADDAAAGGGADGGGADGGADGGGADDAAAGGGTGGDVAPEHGGRRARRRRGSSGGSFWKELPVLLIVAFGLALLIKTLLVQAFFIPSGSMEQTLHGCPGCTGDRVLVNKLVYDFRSPHRGEIVVFDGAGSFDPETTVAPATSVPQKVGRFFSSTLGLGSPTETDFIKRVIAVGGDTVACCTDGNVTVTPKGSSTRVQLHEPYIYQNSPLTGAPCSGREFGPITVPDGRLWVMGDHRSESADSRCHIGENGNGTVPDDEVIGKAFVVVYPFNRIKLLHTPATFGQSGLQASGPAGLGDG